MTIRLIIDSNAYHRASYRRTQNFKSLQKLCAQQHVTLIAPYVIRREVESQLDLDSKIAVDEFVKHGKKLLEGVLSQEARATIERATELLTDPNSPLSSRTVQDFRNWLTSCDAQTPGIDAAHAHAAFEDYFSGTGAQSSVKNREDIPDSFILQAINHEAQDGPLVFVSSDRNLSNAASRIENITHHHRLGSFIGSEAVQQALALMDAQRQEGLTELLLNLGREPGNPMVRYLEDHGGEGHAGSFFRSKSLISEDREAYVDHFGELGDIEIEWESLAYHGDLVYTVPFNGTGTFDISYYVPNYMAHEVETRGGSYRPHNDYVLSASDSEDVFVRGALKITLSDDDLPDGDLADAIQDLSVDSLEELILLEDL